MRIRSTKPEFWRSRTIASVSWDARLVLKGLESYVDDNGVGKDDLELIVSDLFPRDLAREHSRTLARVSEAISELHRAGLVWRYEAEGRALLYVSNWDSIQRVDKPQAGRNRRPDGTLNYRESEIRECSGSPREDSRTVAPVTGEQGNRGTGEQTTTLSDPDGSDPTAYAADFLEFWAIYPRREKKRPAAAAFKRAKKRASVAAIIVGASCYRDDPNREQQYTKLPTTWLDGDCWDDDPLPERRDNVRHLSRNDQTMMGELEWALNQEQQQRLEIEA